MIVGQTASAAANFYAAKVDSEKKTYSKECITQDFIYLDEGHEKRLTREEKKQILTYNETRQRDCGDD